MRRSTILGFATAALCAGMPLAGVAQTQASTAKPASSASDLPLVVPPAKQGVFSQKVSANKAHLSVTGKTFTSREAIEKYLAYRAAELVLAQQGTWFTLVEGRMKGDTVPESKPEQGGMHYSFRMAYWRPVWRYKTADAAAWSSWSPFSGAPFFADGKDPKTITDFEVSADILIHKGPMDDLDPLAFEPRAVSEFLVNQVSPPE